MEIQLEEAVDLKYNPVYISDLTAVIELYLKQNSFRVDNENPTYKRPLLTEDFGLPLYTIWLDKKIVGCSFVLLDAMDKMIFRAVVDNKYFRDSDTSYLISYTENKYLKSEDPISIEGLKNGIHRLVDWLNRSR